MINCTNIAASRESITSKGKDEIEVVLVRFTEFDKSSKFVGKIYNFFHIEPKQTRSLCYHEVAFALESYGLRSVSLRELLAFEIAYPSVQP